MASSSLPSLVLPFGSVPLAIFSLMEITPSARVKQTGRFWIWPQRDWGHYPALLCVSWHTFPATFLLSTVLQAHNSAWVRIED